MDPLLKQIVSSIKQGPKAMRAALEANSGKFTQGIAEEARALYEEAAKAERMTDAMVLAGIAATIFLDLDNKREHLRCRFDLCQFEYMLAATIESYVDARQNFDQLAADAHSIDARDIRSEALLFATECLLRAAQIATDVGTKNPLLRAALTNLVGMMQQGLLKNLRTTLYRPFVSLSCALIDAALNQPFTGTEKAVVDVLLRACATQLETLVPVTYEDSNDIKQTVAVARILGELSRRYGTSASAEARLAAVAKLLDV